MKAWSQKTKFSKGCGKLWLLCLLSWQIILQYRGASRGIARGCKRLGDVVGEGDLRTRVGFATCWVRSVASETSVHLTDFTVKCRGGTRGSLISLRTLEFDRFSLYSLLSSSLLCLFALQWKQMACPDSLSIFRCFLSVNSFSSDWIIRVSRARHLRMLCSLLCWLSYYLPRSYSMLCILWNAWLIHGGHLVFLSLLVSSSSFFVSSDFLKRGIVALLR